MRLFLSSLLVCSFALVACGGNETSGKKPSSAPKATAGDNVDTSGGDLQDDDEGLCDGVEDFEGVCDDEMAELAWFCADGDLYLLDCSELDPDWICVEDSVSWDCDYAE